MDEIIIRPVKVEDSEAYIMKYIRKETRVLEGLRHASILKDEEIAEVQRKLSEYGSVKKCFRSATSWDITGRTC